MKWSRYDWTHTTQTHLRPCNQREIRCLYQRLHNWSSHTSSASHRQNTRKLLLKQRPNDQVGDPIEKHTDLLKHGYRGVELALFVEEKHWATSIQLSFSTHYMVNVVVDKQMTPDYREYWLLLICSDGKRSCTTSVIWRQSWLSYHAIPWEVFVYVTSLRQGTCLTSVNSQIISTVLLLLLRTRNLSKSLSGEYGKLHMTTQFVHKHWTEKR